jgi:hypothetical protein
MSCNMCYNSIDENSNSLTVPFQNNGCKGIKAQYEHTFSELHFSKMNYANSTKLYLIKNKEILNITKSKYEYSLTA